MKGKSVKEKGVRGTADEPVTGNASLTARGGSVHRSYRYTAAKNLDGFAAYWLIASIAKPSRFIRNIQHNTI